MVGPAAKHGQVGWLVPEAWFRAIYTEGGPEAFYKGFGFVETGEIDDGEVVCRLLLGRPAVAKGAS
ncbi:MAG TPA: hypothetical protein VLS92_04775 [Acidimicrobiia bacterium]|nr:hypothetical protein [Acidimicrobiia bacterium]